MAYDGTANSEEQFVSIAQAFSGIYSGTTGISALLKTITDTLPLGFYVIDARSEKIVYFNERFCDIWGLGHLKEKMRSGTLDNRDIAQEIVRRIDSVNASPTSCAMHETGSSGAAIDELSLADGRIMRRFSACISIEDGSHVGSLYAFEDITEQARAREKIRKSNERYMELADSLPQIVFEMDLQGNITFTNRSAYALLGFTEGDFDQGMNALGIIAPEDRERALDNMAAVLKGGESGNEYTFLHKDGSRMPAIVNSTPVLRDGRAVGFRGIIVDITGRRNMEEQIRSALQEKEMLLKEIHHRVRNNLQVISSLLSLQMAYVDDFVAVGLLRESQSRIRTIALVHEKLYGSVDLVKVDFKDYLQKLGAHLVMTNAAVPGKHLLTFEGDDVTMEPDIAVPCGLIMSELITDSLKRATANDLPNDIRIGLRDGEHITITYTDSIPGYPERASGNEQGKFSRQLVSMLIEQLDGTFDYDMSQNTLIIRFPAKKKNRQVPADGPGRN